jgi:hypothetical protein
LKRGQNPQVSNLDVADTPALMTGRIYSYAGSRLPAIRPAKAHDGTMELFQNATLLSDMVFVHCMPAVCREVGLI